MAENKQTAGETAIQQVFTYNFSDVPIRLRMEGDTVWFVAKDVCKALNITWSGNTLAQIPDEWKGVLNFNTPGGNQELTCISEAGMYKLAFRCQSSKVADDFTNKVASEILPSIRKTGRYELAPSKPKHERRTFGGDVLDLRCEPYNTKWLGTTTVRVVEHDDVEWYSVADINRAMQVGTDAVQSARMLRDANPAIVCKIFIFGNTHPAWFTTITGLRLLVSGSRKLKSRSRMLQLQEGGAR